MDGTTEWPAEYVGVGLNETLESILDTACGCISCADTIQPGHTMCSPVSHEARALEERGVIQRVYIDGAWKWVVRIELVEFGVQN
jgi:hypothetical protein